MDKGEEGCPAPHGAKKKGRWAKRRENGRRGQVGKGKGGLDLDICPGAPRVPSYATD